MRRVTILLSTALLLAVFLISGETALADDHRFMPVQIASRPDGCVYALVQQDVINTSDRVFIYAPDGRLAKTVDPNAINLAADAAGNLFVLDETYDKNGTVSYFNISRLDRYGNATVLRSYAGRSGVNAIVDMTVSPDGTLYFSTLSGDDNSQWEIDAIDANGTLRTVFTKNASLISDGFHSLAVGRDGTIYTAGVDNQITVISPEGETRTIGKPGSENGTFIRVVDLAIGPDGCLYVADAGNRRVQKLTADGTFVDARTGCGPDPFTDFLKIAVGENGRLYVADNRNDRIVWLTSEYAYGLDKTENMKGEDVTWGTIYAGTNYSTRQLMEKFNELQYRDATPSPGFSPFVAITGLFLACAALCIGRNTRQ